MSNSPLRERVGQLKGDMQGGSPMGTMLDKAEERGMEKQRKLDEAEMKRQAARIAELEAELAALKAAKENS